MTVESAPETIASPDNGADRGENEWKRVNLRVSDRPRVDATWET